MYDLIELIIETSLWSKDYSTFDTHTQHTSLMFNEYLFHLCDCTCLNVMCVCSTICGSNQKYFCSFCLLLEVICITHVFQSFSSCFCVKNMFSGYFHNPFHVLAQLGVKWSNFKVFSTLDRKFHDCFASSSRVRLTREKFREYFRESASRKNF